MKQLIVIISMVFMASCFSKEPAKSGKEGKPMPEFSLLAMDSITVIRSSEILKDKPSVLFYFSPYCPFCKAQTKDMIENMEELKDIQFYFISAFPFAALKEYQKSYQLAKYPNIIVARDSTDDLSRYFEITGVPYK
jgi:peroxiredoxin